MTKFRKDINGLRAIAVIAVVLFHFNPYWMPGGFAGVDVFFVISGFLMTRIIFSTIENEKFSLLHFYVARANRIIPALAILCFVLLIVGWLYLTPLDYKALAKHIAGSLSFVSNIIYWKESGYFDVASHEKWLLHTWSLSAEWQFYMIYPLMLVVMHKFIHINTMKKMVVIATILGFIFCVIATEKWPDPAYYLIPTRAWEMMLGGVAYLYPLTLKQQRKKQFEWLGLILIIGSYCLISKDNPWPGYLAILPVLGTFLIIQAQRNDSLISSNVVMQKIGTWSYSIYLWHWPIVVAIYYFSLNEIFIYLGILLSLLLGFLSHQYIENMKFRNDFSNVFSYLKCKPIYMIFLAGILSSMIIHTNGVDSAYRSMALDPKSIYLKRYFSKKYMDNLHITFKDECNFYDYYTEAFEKVKDEIAQSCIAIDKHKKTILIWGDSHAQAIAQGFQGDSYNLIQIATSNCKPDINQKLNSQLSGVMRQACIKSNAYVLEVIKKLSPEIVIMAQRNNHELTDFNSISQSIKGDGVKQVIVMGPVIQLSKGSSMPKLITIVAFNADKKYIDFSTLDNHVVSSEEIMKNTSAKNYLYISLFDFLCANNHCLAKVDSNNTPLLFDYEHLTYEGANYIYKHYLKGLIEKL